MRINSYRKIVGILILIVSISNLACGQETPVTKKKIPSAKIDVKVTYIANEGVLIETKGKKILIDGLHRKYKDAYAFPPDELREKLEGAKAPYNDLDLLLVSHLHGDHFHPISIGNHLQNNQRAILASSEQIVDSVKNDFENSTEIESRVKLVSHKWKTFSQQEINGVRIKFLGLRHGGDRFKSTENFGHLIEADGSKFLHIGDADMTDENFSTYKLNEEKIDIAFIPYWFLLSKGGRDLVKRQFDPEHIIAVHVSPSEVESVSKELKEYYPDITVFTRILETKSF